MELRDYQLEAIQRLMVALASKKSGLLVLSTGLGKTLTTVGFCQRVLSVRPNARFLFLVNKVKLAEQTARVFSPHFDVSIYCNTLGEKVQSAFTIASIQSLSSANELDHYDILIADEAHRFDDRSGSQYMNLYTRLKEKNPKIFLLGLTATPYRNTGRIYGPGKLWESIDYQKGLRWAIDNGWLVRPILKHTKERFLTTGLRTRMGDFDQKQVNELTTNMTKVQKQIADAMPQLEGRKKVVWHCSCIEHAELVSRNIPEPSVVYHSGLSQEEQVERLALFEKGDIRHLCFVMIISEAYDYPPLDAIVLMRPTKSACLYVQVVGRGLRLSQDKTDCLVLDYGEVVASCGPLDDPHVPEKGASKKMVASLMKFCPKCLEYLKATEKKCFCGHEFKADPGNFLKALSTKSYSGDILKKMNEWIPIAPDRSSIQAHISQSSGNACIKLCFAPKNLLSTKRYYKYVVIESDNKFLVERGAKTMRTIFNTDFNASDVSGYIQEVKDRGLFFTIADIQVDHRGKYPDIIGYRYNEIDIRRTQES